MISATALILTYNEEENIAPDAGRVILDDGRRNRGQWEHGPDGGNRTIVPPKRADRATDIR